MKLWVIAVFAGVSLFNAQSQAKNPNHGKKAHRTYGQSDYKKDKFRDENHVFGVYEPVSTYTDPDFNEARQLTSPFVNDRYFESYDVAIIININNSKDENQNLIRGQTLRVYARDRVLSELGLDRFRSTQYDPNTNLLYYWKTSTARPGKVTPRGYFRPQAFSSNHFSSLYNDSPMPWALFFNGSIATHGVLGSAIANLGNAASAGCARLEPQRAEDLFNLVGLVGKGWVDKIEKSKLVTRPDGSIEQEIHWKTLIKVQ